MDASTVYSLLIKFASSGGTIYAVATACACLLLTAIIGYDFYRVNKKDRDTRDAKTDLKNSCENGDPNQLRNSIKRLRNLSD